MVAIWVSPVTRTSVTVTKPSRGSLIRRSSISATITWIRSAILRTRGLLMVVVLRCHRIPEVSRFSSASSSMHATGSASSPRYLGNSTVPQRASAPRDLLHLERLDDIAFLDVVVALDHQTTLEALADLGRVVLLPLQRGQVGALQDDVAVTDQPDLRVAADHAAG